MTRRRVPCTPVAISHSEEAWRSNSKNAVTCWRSNSKSLEKQFKERGNMSRGNMSCPDLEEKSCDKVAKALI